MSFYPTNQKLANINTIFFVCRDINFEVTEHNSPLGEHGCRGSGKTEFLQPVSVTVDMESGLIYVLDTGNSRIKVLSLDLEFIRHIENDGLKGRSCTGMNNNQMIFFTLNSLRFKF